MGKQGISFSLLVVAAVLARGSAGAAGQVDRFTAVPLVPAESHGASAAATSQLSAVDPVTGEKMVGVIVKLADEPAARYRGGVAGLAATSPAVAGTTRLDARRSATQAYLAYLTRQQAAFEAMALTAIPSARVLHHYRTVFGGVAMVVPQSGVNRLATLPGVRAVYPDTLNHIDTTRSPQFIGAQKLWNKLGGQTQAGEGVIVGIIDTGIWPEHPSFSDPDPFGNPLPAPPAQWTGTTCQFSGGANPGPAFTCNNKLIGAYRLMTAYDANNTLLAGEFTTARDDEGHGTHTSSTAAGDGNVSATLLGIARGTASGIAPRAHVVMYRVCGNAGCYGSDSMAAVDQAVTDGVDVINFSISGGDNPYSDIVELAFLDAYEAGVFVAASAGNSGPTADTTSHRGPWVTTVAASSSDRFFISDVSLDATGGDMLMLQGASVTAGIGSPTPLLNAADIGDALCQSATADGAFSGKIAICQRGTNARVAKSYNVAQRGAVGMLLYNPTLQGLATDNFFIPGVHLENDAGAALLAFLSGHTGEMATFTQGIATTVPGDVMAAFSSRGGPGQTLGVSKPDVTAPGVQILAGNTPQPSTMESGLPGELFQAIQGTSMSSPHVAGSAALLRALHPSWSPGKIKSALMTTAVTLVVKEDGTTPADPFDDGSGRINLRKAGKPGLSFDVAASDYMAHQSDLWSVNYPSVYIPSMPGDITVERTAHNETAQAQQWQLQGTAPSGVHVIVPPVLNVPASGDAPFDIRVKAFTVPMGEVRHASVTMTNGSKQLHLPITIRREEPSVTLDKTCTPGTLALGGTTDCTITATNTTFDDATVTIKDKLPAKLALLGGTVVGATPTGNKVTFSGVLMGGTPAPIMIGTGVSPAGGYLPLSLFGIPPLSGVADDAVINFTTDPFVYAGATYTSLGMGSNGIIVVGGGSGPDATFVNQSFPDPTPPNNVLAPFWTDLYPPGGGALRLGYLTDGVDTWIVADWAGTPNYTGGAPNSFEAWIGVNGVEDITYAYGTVSSGSSSLLTVGAENVYGNSGANRYYNGTGTAPTSGTQLRVSSTPGTAGETHIITFTAQGAAVGNWKNCAKMTGDIFFGTNVDCFTGGHVTP